MNMVIMMRIMYLITGVLGNKMTFPMGILDTKVYNR